MDLAHSNVLIISVAALVAIAIVAMAVCIVVVGKAVYAKDSPAASESFGVLFLALPSLSTVILIVTATGVLAAMHIIPAAGCIAIFSSVASFVLGGQSERRNANRSTPPAPIAHRSGQTSQPANPKASGTAPHGKSTDVDQAGTVGTSTAGEP